MSDFGTAKQVAALCGITPQRISQLRKERKDAPKVRKRGQMYEFHLPSWVSWYFQEFKKPAPTVQSSLAESERRKALADADIAEQKAEQLRGSLLPADDVRTEMYGLVSALRSTIDSMDSQYADRILGLENVLAARAALAGIKRDLLAQLRDVELPVIEEPGVAA